ncbi:hypothetical protein [Spongiivirga citrea]|uniref:Cardiolipin synthetase n=1 Tax=Spongiivirga citrea TaxID=1481457 RepID=A0A6M0CIN7_9FLAO|nr:hypothetical protein [Spongiivirga citrea]NER16823.1 hypothetical protein [Spongiivirga citrea]
MKNLLLLIFAITMLISCSSSKMVQQYKNPETVSFEANKVLVIGITPDEDVREIFEKRVVKSLEKQNVRAVKSIDFFESSFTNNKQSLEQLNNIENQLLDAGFDAILFAKVIGKEDKVSIIQSYNNLGREFHTFEDYYFSNQHLYLNEQKQSYTVYNTETSLYCICPGKERELLWRGEIEVVDADNVNRNINKYLNILFKGLKDNQLLVSAL